MKVALVYDRVNKVGGAERVLVALHEIWPKAPLYTAVYNRAGSGWAKDFAVIPSFLDKMPVAKRHHEFFPWLAPLAFEGFDFTGYEMVISVSSAEAKGIITQPETFHVNYCLTPTRYLWGENRYEVPVVTNYLRKWDLMASQRPDKIISVSETVRERVKKYYQRESEVVYPPVDVKKFQIPDSKFQMGAYFLIVSRLVKYKRIDLAIRAFNKLGWRLKIIGVGREMGYLKSLAQKNIEFLGQLTDEELVRYYQESRALIFTSEEDFGLVPLEAQACGRPVVAYQGGGATETVIEGVTGAFFDKQTWQSLAAKLQSFRATEFKSEECRKNAIRFNEEKFKREFKSKLEREYQKWMSRS
jgi:glycosyltransferase involved in cell wall biosynthesis